MKVIGAAPESIETVAEILLAGGVAVLPTDTVYGLCAVPSDPEATSKLFECKGRAASTPVAVLCPSVEAVWDLAGGQLSPAARAFGEQHWPGPLTLVVPRRADLEWDLGEPHDTIGVRVPDDTYLLDLLARVGPIAATSANRHGQPTPSTAREAAAELLCDVDVVVAGRVLAGAASTVVDATGESMFVLRPGPIELPSERRFP